MSLLSKLLGGKKAEKAALGLIEDLLNGKKPEQQNEQTEAAAPAAETAHSYTYAEPSGEPSPSGFSWGEEMPQEENQFNYPGTYVEYFRHVFLEEFPDYRVEYSAPRGVVAPVFTFYNGENKALVVELLASSSEAKKLRADCQKAGVPYLRYYYDHHGWWNTRRYVVERTRAALNG